MKILNRLSIKNLKMNKKRTIGTIVGIILSTALICAVAGMGTSFHKTLVENASGETGYYHIALMELSKSDVTKIETNRDVDKAMKIYDLGYSEFDHSDDDNPYIKVISTDDFDGLAFTILEGRKPKNSDEIVVNKKVLTASNYKIGDEIELDIGTRMTNDGYTLNISNPYIEGEESLVNATHHKYKIVGVFSKIGYNSFYYGMTTKETDDNVNIYIALKNPYEYKTSIPELLGLKNYTEVFDQRRNALYQNYDINTELLRWEVFAFSDSTVSMIYAVFIVVIIIIVVTSVFCIRNSFAISTTEKTKLYGMLSSVGATKRQIKRNVLFEGFIQGLIGIPLGILGGVLAVYVLTKVVTLVLGDMLFTHIDHFYFYISWLPIIVAVVLGFVTIYFSALSSARKASKISPIDNLRGAKDVRIKSNKLKAPRIIERIFGMGGVLAYKNLKRSKKKYRTTVVSLAVSVFVFIAMSAFLNETFDLADKYYGISDYNIQLNSVSKLTEKDISAIRNLSSVKSSNVVYDVAEGTNGYLRVYDKKRIVLQDHESYDRECRFVDEEPICDGEEYMAIGILGLSDIDFKSYVKALGIDYETSRSSGILLDQYDYYDGSSIKKVHRYTYQKGDVIEGFIGEEATSIGLAIVTDKKPSAIEKYSYDGGFLIVNKDVYSDYNYAPYAFVIDSSNPEATVKEIENLKIDVNISNLEDDIKENKAMRLIVSIFLYGFIIVITLIGVTNIFNTITSNMELRSKEFAMLKSIGMTKREFSHMVNLETLFYSSKALLYGIIMGLLGSFAFAQAFKEKNGGIFNVPWIPILISILFVFLLVYAIMKFSISKINKQNTIETIRNDNV